MNTKYGYIKYLSKNEKRRGEAGFLLFLNTCIKDKYLNPGDVLLTDNESSLKTNLVKNLLVIQRYSSY